MNATWKLQAAMDALNAGYSRLLDDDPEMALPSLPVELAGVTEAILAVAREARRAEALGECARKMAQETGGRAKRFETRVDQLRGVALAALDALGERRIEGPDVSVFIRAGQPGTLITDEGALPERFWRIERKLDRATLKTALTDGEVIPGAELTNAMPSLTIKGT